MMRLMAWPGSKRAIDIARAAAFVVALVASAGACGSTGNASGSASSVSPTTQMLFRRDAFVAAVHDVRVCLAAPVGSCRAAVDRLQDELNQTGAPLAGLEMRSTIPVRTIVALRGDADRLSRAMDTVRTCSDDRAADKCPLVLPKILASLDTLSQEAQAWPGPVATP